MVYSSNYPDISIGNGRITNLQLGRSTLYVFFWLAALNGSSYESWGPSLGQRACDG